MSEQEQKQKMSEWFTPDEPQFKEIKVTLQQSYV